MHEKGFRLTSTERTGFMNGLTILRPLFSVEDEHVSSATATLHVCQSSVRPGEEFVLKWARPGHNLQIKEEARTIERLRNEGISEAISLIADGQFQDRYGLVMPFAEGKPIGGEYSRRSYELPIADKTKVVAAYLQFVLHCYRVGYAKIDHQAEGVFYNGNSIKVVDFFSFCR